MIPHERVKKTWYSFTGQKEREPQSDAVKVANIVTAALVVMVFTIMVFSIVISILNQKQTYEIDIELSGNMSLPDYIGNINLSEYKDINIKKVRIKGRAVMPVYTLKGI